MFIFKDTLTHIDMNTNIEDGLKVQIPKCVKLEAYGGEHKLDYTDEGEKTQ